VKPARENCGWGYDRIVGALANLGHKIFRSERRQYSAATWIAPSPKRKQSTTWSDFIGSHMDVLAGTDFFTVEVLDVAGPGDVLCAVLHSSGQPAGIDRWNHGSSQRLWRWSRWLETRLWRNWDACTHADIFCMIATTKFCESFREVLKAGGETTEVASEESNLNAFAERWVRSVKEECLSEVDSVRRGLR